jgi:hypothetical protein
MFDSYLIALFSVVLLEGAQKKPVAACKTTEWSESHCMRRRALRIHHEHISALHGNASMGVTNGADPGVLIGNLYIFPGIFRDKGALDKSSIPSKADHFLLQPGHGFNQLL